MVGGLLNPVNDGPDLSFAAAWNTFAVGYNYLSHHANTYLPCRISVT